MVITIFYLKYCLRVIVSPISFYGAYNILFKILTYRPKNEFLYQNSVFSALSKDKIRTGYYYTEITGIMNIFRNVR